MRRVVVTGMGIVSSIGNNTRKCLRVSTKQSRASLIRKTMPSSVSGRRFSAGRLSILPMWLIVVQCVSSVKALRGITSRWSKRSAIRDWKSPISSIRAPASSWDRRPVRARHRRSCRHHRTKGPKRVGPFAVPKAMSSTALRDIGDLVQDQGRQLFDLVGLRHVEPLHRNAYETIQVGKQDIIFAGGCEDLDWTMSVLVRRHGCDVVEIHDTPATGIARL